MASWRYDDGEKGIVQVGFVQDHNLLQHAEKFFLQVVLSLVSRSSLLIAYK